MRPLHLVQYHWKKYTANGDTDFSEPSTGNTLSILQRFHPKALLQSDIFQILSLRRFRQKDTCSAHWEDSQDDPLLSRSTQKKNLQYELKDFSTDKTPNDCLVERHSSLFEGLPNFPSKPSVDHLRVSFSIHREASDDSLISSYQKDGAGSATFYSRILQDIFVKARESWYSTGQSRREGKSLDDENKDSDNGTVLQTDGAIVHPVLEIQSSLTNDHDQSHPVYDIAIPELNEVEPNFGNSVETMLGTSNSASVCDFSRCMISQSLPFICDLNKPLPPLPSPSALSFTQDQTPQPGSESITRNYGSISENSYFSSTSIINASAATPQYVRHHNHFQNSFSAAHMHRRSLSVKLLPVPPVSPTPPLSSDSTLSPFHIPGTLNNRRILERRARTILSKWRFRGLKGLSPLTKPLKRKTRRRY